MQYVFFFVNIPNVMVMKLYVKFSRSRGGSSDVSARCS